MSPDAPLMTTLTTGFWHPAALGRLSKVAGVTEEHAAAPRLRDGVRAALPLAPSPILFGLSYGVLADATGFGRVAAIVMSATTFAGASQFASISVFDAGGTVVAAALAAIFLNARYAAISLTVASIFPGGRLRRLIESQAIVDESWALSGRRGTLRMADPRRRRDSSSTASGSGAPRSGR